MCEPCSALKKAERAFYFCHNCSERYCEACSLIHKTQKSSRQHRIVPFKDDYIDVIKCESCDFKGISSQSTKLCKECEEYICDSCAIVHLSFKENKNHTISKIMKKINCNPCSGNGKTATAVKICSDCKEPEPLCASCADNHIAMKRSRNHKFTDTVNLDVDEALKNLYVTEKKSICSDSDFIYERESPAVAIVKNSKPSTIGPPAVYILPIKENKAARNETSQTRKFTLGSPGTNNKEKTIMIVGATGCGKSTLVNSIANYVMGVTWEDSFRFTLVNLEKSEKSSQGNEAISQTKWITCYTIYTNVSRLDYTINIIDTPGFGDTAGLTQDAKVVSQIRELFTTPVPMGVTDLDAVCFILKAPDARLSITQKYIFESILALFGKDIVDNICTLVTFADGQKPPVLACLKALSGNPIPYNVYFPFNNSALFVNNTKKDQASLSSFFWAMGMKSCENFFSAIQSLQTKSLLLTSEVLTKRQKLENTILHLQEDIDKGLTKINSLEKQIEMLKKYECQIKENKDFEFTVVVPDIKKVDISGKGIHTTTCLVCNYTCHNNCAFAKDEDKERCVAMTDGKCTECPKRCNWDIHFNLPHIYEHKTKTIKKTYSEMQVKYQEASKKKLTHGQLIQEINADIQTLECGIQVMIEKITEYTNRLKEIALRPDPLSTVEYIELMIESEKLEKNKGFLQRIQVLEQCKRRAQFGKSYDFFTQRLKTSRTHIDQGYHQEPTQYSEQEIQRFSHNAIQNFMKLFSKVEY